MKKLFTSLFFFILSFLFSFPALAQQEIKICQLKEGTAERPGKVVASINEAKLPAGVTCSAWLEQQRGTSPKKCQLLARGDQAFEGFNGIPARGTVVWEGFPSQGKNCDQERYDVATRLIKG
jgi:hypothetical protein